MGSGIRASLQSSLNTLLVRMTFVKIFLREWNVPWHTVFSLLKESWKQRKYSNSYGPKQHRSYEVCGAGRGRLWSHVYRVAPLLSWINKNVSRRSMYADAWGERSGRTHWYSGVTFQGTFHLHMQGPWGPSLCPVHHDNPGTQNKARHGKRWMSEHYFLNEKYRHV